MTETTAYEGYCEAHRCDEPCEHCADEDRAMKWMRDRAAALADRAEGALDALDSLSILLAEVAGDHFYREFCQLTMDDDDAAACLSEARRAMRSFARIAHQRAARTEQQPWQP